MRDMERFDVLIIGAGASGLAAASAAAGKGRNVAVLERNDKPARKICATGNGRCNYSNRAAEHSAEVIEALACGLGIEGAEEDGRLYPRSFEAASVAEALVSGAERAGARVFCGARAVSVQKNVQGFVVECDDGRIFECGSLVLSTGGKAGIQYGCYGDGYKFAEALGHSVVKPIPALDGLVCEEDISKLHGVRVKAKATLLGGEMALPEPAGMQPIASETGEVQFTKDGISGICVMDLSRYVRLEKGLRYELVLDLFPEHSEEELKKLFVARKKAFGCGLSWLLPEKLKDYMHVAVAGLPGSGPERMASLAKSLHFTITGTRGWKTAQTTCGGVPLAEVDPETFESLKMPGLFITGELLDFDGPCGGFNLNWAFFSGLRAGRSI